MSRLQQAHKAVRPALKARALLSGPPGAGKTRSALITAETLAEGGTVLVIDTEKESALTYADDFTFDHLAWEPPFNPRDLAEAVLDAGTRWDVVIVDSLSHFWRGDGGTLDIAGGKFSGWKDARPAQIDMVEALLRCDAHVVLCARSKVELAQEFENGRHVVRKLGMAVIQDDELAYEINVALELDMDHSMTVSKSRTTAVPVGRIFKAGHAQDFARTYRDWLKGGEPLAQAKTVAALTDRMNALPKPAKVAAKQEFFARFGMPDHLRQSQVADAEVFVAGWEIDAAGSGGGDEEPVPPPAPTPPPPPPPPVLAAVASDDDKLSAAQSKALHSGMRKAGILPDDRHAWLTAMLDRDVKSASDLSRSEASRLIDRLLDGNPDEVASS